MTKPNEPINPIFNEEINGYILEGITKREYFAAQAMQGLLADSNRGFVITKDIPEVAVKIADAIIEELNKTETK